MPRSVTGSLENPRISEAGRKFLAERLLQLTDAQLHDLFDVARFPDRIYPDGKTADRVGTVDQWVDVFKRKRNEIASVTCP